MGPVERSVGGVGTSGAGADEMPTTIKTAAESYLRQRPCPVRLRGRYRDRLEVHAGPRADPLAEVAQKFHFGSQLGLWAAFMYPAAFAARSACWAATFVVSPGSLARLYNSGVASGPLFTLLRTAFQGPNRTAWARPALWYSQ